VTRSRGGRPGSLPGRSLERTLRDPPLVDPDARGHRPTEAHAAGDEIILAYLDEITVAADRPPTQNPDAPRCGSSHRVREAITAGAASR